LPVTATVYVDFLIVKRRFLQLSSDADAAVADHARRKRATVRANIVLLFYVDGLRQ
jgi:hypothetical protein